MDSGFNSEDQDFKKVENFQKICDLVLITDDNNKENDEPKGILKGSVDIPVQVTGATAMHRRKSVTFSPTNILHVIPHRPNFNPQSPRMPVRKRKPLRTTTAVRIEPSTAVTGPPITKPKPRGHKRTSSYSPTSIIIKELNESAKPPVKISKFSTQVDKEERQRLLDDADQMVGTPIEQITSSVPEFDYNNEDYEWSYDFQASSTPQSEPEGLRALQGVEEINWRLTPIIRALSTPPKELRKLTGSQNYGTLQQVQLHLNSSISDSEESTTEISPLLTTYDPDATVQGLLQRTTESEVRKDRNRMCEILLLVIFLALVLFLYLLEEGWLTSLTYPMSETFLKLILIFSVIIILLIYSGCMANCHYLSEIRCLRRGQQI